MKAVEYLKRAENNEEDWTRSTRLYRG
jgi:hypothetical protein